MTAKTWLRHYPEDIPQTLTYPEKPLYDFLDRSAEQYEKAPALVFFGQRITYGQLRELVDRFAAALIRIGAKPGEKISLMLPISRSLSSHSTGRSKQVSPSSRPIPSTPKTNSK